MIYTSYFANLDKIPEDFKLISIARFKLETSKRKIFELKAFIPSQELFTEMKSNKISELNYTIRYIKQISDIKNLNELVHALNTLYGLPEQNCVLLCWEGKNKFCHRHILAEYLNINFNTNIREF